MTETPLFKNARIVNEGEIREENVLSKCGWSPFVGREMTARVDGTAVSGRIAWEDGRMNEPAAGRRLAFDRA